MRAMLVLVMACGVGLAESPIRLPEADPPPHMPVPVADPLKLTAGSLYVVDSDVPVVVMSSPAGMVTVTADEGPMKVRAVFAGIDRVQTKTFKGKHLFVVEAVAGKVGPVELFVVPVGFKAESDIIRRTLSVNGGEGPQPPGPGPDPKPEPDKWEPSPLIVLVIEETGESAATRGAFFTDAALAARMKDKNHKWRVVDKDVVGPDGKPPEDLKRFLEAAKNKKLPQVFVVDPKGKTRFQGDCPNKASELIDRLKTVGG